MNESEASAIVILQQLRNLADAALSEKLEKEDQLEAIEVYCARFREVQNQLKNLDDQELPDLAVLSEQHEKIIDKAKTLLAEAAQDMQKFKKKARGIMAYVDILPRKISVTGMKKG